MDLVYGLQLVFVNKISPEYGHICLPVANGCFHAKVAKTLWSTKSRTLTICACKKTAELWKQGQKKNQKGTYLVVQWPSHAGDMGSMPGWETKIPHAPQSN